MSPEFVAHVSASVRGALAEDVGSGDVTAALVPAKQRADATIVTREGAVICGQPWVNEVFRQLDPGIVIEWHIAEGADATQDQILCALHGPARPLLTGERTALNFLQLLSGIATAAARYAAALEGTGVRVLDTRKTAPGMRVLEKRAVALGGGTNHRMGLWDMALIKDNHIAAAGGIVPAVARVRAAGSGVAIEVEVTTLDGLREALDAGVDRVMLDNMPVETMREAVRVARAAGRPPEIEISGGVTIENLRSLAALGPDFISVGAVTHSAPALDMSLEIGECA